MYNNMINDQITIKGLILYLKRKPHFSGDKYFIDYGLYGIQTSSQDRKCELDIHCEKRQSIRELSEHAKSKVLKLEHFRNQ